MSTDNHDKIPSLIDPEATGGYIAGGGFDFQDGVSIGYLPSWLSDDGFQSMLSEGLGDFEGSFYVPGRGTVKELLEVKDHQVTPAELWREVRRFKGLYSGNTTAYRRFILVAHSFSAGLSPLKNALVGVRKPASFYAGDLAVTDKSYKDYEAIVESVGGSKEEARFIHDFVVLDDEQGVASSAGSALFLERAAELPVLADLSQTTLKSVYGALIVLIRERRRSEIARVEIERTAWEAIPTKNRPPALATRIFTRSATSAGGVGLELNFSEFSGTERVYPPPAQWNTEVVERTIQVREWIKQCRSVRHVVLSGERRLSTSLAIGSVFSAVQGFELDMHFRGECWRVSGHPSDGPDPYEFEEAFSEGTSDELVFDLSVWRDGRKSVTQALQHLKLHEFPRLSVFGSKAIQSDLQLANFVSALKHILCDRISQCAIKKVHLFLLGPSSLALALGYRINGTATIQCYEWSGGNEFAPTAILPI